MSLKDKSAVVTGGSKGLGLGLVEALVAHGARVTVVAGDADALESVRTRMGVAIISADVTDETAAHRILAELRPDILALNAGATPPMGRLDQLSWADFTAPWDHYAKAGLYWLQAALNQPLKPGFRRAFRFSPGTRHAAASTVAAAFDAAIFTVRKCRPPPRDEI